MWFERVEQDGSRVQVYFANGRSECADLLVGCDGLWHDSGLHACPHSVRYRGQSGRLA
jgi:hypothetical protein